MKKQMTILLLLTALGISFAQEPYKVPSKEVVDILDAPPTPIVSVNPTRDAMMLVEYQAHPSVALLAQPYYRIAGLRINPELNARQRITQYTGVLIKWINTNKEVRVNLPKGATISVPLWSNDGKKIAFTRDLSDGVELWVADASTGIAKPLANIRVNDVLGSPIEWMSDNIHVLVKTIPTGRGKAPEAPKVPVGPVIEETSGKQAGSYTYQDLLKNPHDENLFEYFATTQLARINSVTGAVQPIGKAGMYSAISVSPDQQYLLVTTLKRPFSYRVPSFYFSRTVDVLDKIGVVVRTIADFGVSDDIPTQGVVTGPRGVEWQALHNSTLVWSEALDGGDPKAKVPHRDQLMSLSAPFKGNARLVTKLEHRYAGFNWTAAKDVAFLSEYNRDRRWRTTYVVNVTDPEKTRKTLFDLSVQDAYNDPGNPIYSMT
ncbi:MAG TPA: S9 family peptidase, partial [Bacteroidota bacterium]